MKSDCDSDASESLKAGRSDEGQRQGRLGTLRGAWGMLLSQLNVKSSWDTNDLQQDEFHQGPEVPRRQNSFDSKTRSLAIDQYLEAEARRAQNEPNVVVIGDLDKVQMLWKAAHLMDEPMTREKKRSMRDKTRDCVFRAMMVMLDDCFHNESDPESRHVTQSLDFAFHEVLSENGECSREDYDRVLSYLERDEHREKLEHLEEAARNYETGHNMESFLHCAVCTEAGSILGLLKRLCQPDYEPSEHDWYHFDFESQYITKETTVEMEQLTIRLIKVKSSCCSRKILYRCLDDAHYVIYMMDLGIYDKYFIDDCANLVLRQEIASFGTTASSERFRDKTFILALTNAATLERKLLRKPLKNFMPEYDGDETVDGALRYIHGLCLKAAGNRPGVYTYTDDLNNSTDVMEMLRFIEAKCLAQANGKET